MNSSGGKRANALSQAISAIRTILRPSTFSWLKTKLGIASLATILAVPAGVFAWQAQEQSSTNGQSSESASNNQPEKSNGSPNGSPNHQAAGNSSTDNSSISSKGSSSTVTINGEQFSLSGNGSLHRVFQNPNSTTTIDISQSSSGGNNSSDINFHSSSTSITTVGGQHVNSQSN